MFSLIFEVRTVIFGTDGLYLYVDRGINFHKDLKRLHFDRFFMDHPLRFSRYNVRVSGADLVVLAHFRREKVHLWNLSSPSICGPWNLFSPGSEDVDN